MCHAKRWLQFIRSICQYHLRGSFVTPQMLGTVPFINYKFVFNGLLNIILMDLRN